MNIDDTNGMGGWQPIETAPKDEYIILGYTQQGDEMPHGLYVGMGLVSSNSGKVWVLNSWDNEKALPSYWMPLPAPPPNPPHLPTCNPKAP